MTFASEVEHPLWVWARKRRRHLKENGWDGKRWKRGFNKRAARDLIEMAKKIDWYDGPDKEKKYSKLEARIHKALRRRGE